MAIDRLDRRRTSMSEFLNYLLAMVPVRDGVDFFAGESASLLCLELLLNQRVGVERASAAALALHYHYGKPIPGLDVAVSEATAWPYRNCALRRPAIHL